MRRWIWAGVILLVISVLCSTLDAGAAPAVSWNSRYGVAFDRFESGDNVLDYDIKALGVQWFYDFGAQRAPRRPDGVEYVQMVWRPTSNPTQLAANTGAAVANPGSAWLIGNECDNAGQCALTPEQYAAGYHDHYYAIKASDPTALIFAGGVTQPTPIRLRWLDAMLAAYQARYGEPLPADGWHVHLYILPEACGWGVGIPVGLSNAGDAFDCSYGDRHADLKTFISRLADFRLWMRLNGHQSKPLIVSEYGVLLGPEHGYHTQRVADYLKATFDHMEIITDTASGLPADDYRLVQRWAWFSVNYRPFPSTALFDPYNKTTTAIGAAYATTVAGRLSSIPTATATLLPTATATSTATATPTPTATSTATPAPSATPAMTPTATHAATPDPCKLSPGGCGEPTNEQDAREPLRRLYLPLIQQ